MERDGDVPDMIVIGKPIEQIFCPMGWDFDCSV